MNKVMENYLLNNIIKKFLLRYFFILKAASEGWSVRYLGCDEFKFYKSRKLTKIKSINKFINQFSYELI
jgi:hypothetical protein